MRPPEGCKISQVKGDGMVKETEWFQGYRSLVLLPCHTRFACSGDT